MVPHFFHNTLCHLDAKLKVDIDAVERFFATQGLSDRIGRNQKSVAGPHRRLPEQQRIYFCSCTVIAIIYIFTYIIK